MKKLGTGKINNQDIADLCASFQQAAGDILIDRCKNALTQFQSIYPAGNTLVVAGGVAANKSIGKHLTDLKNMKKLNLLCHLQNLCTDNAAMIAWAGLELLKSGQNSSLNFKPGHAGHLIQMLQLLLVPVLRLKFNLDEDDLAIFTQQRHK